MNEFSFLTSSYEETQNLAKQIGAHLNAGDILLLSGDLGAGKTTFSQGIGSALGIREMTSPTFVISKLYKGHTKENEMIRLLHLDLYRINTDSLGVFDDLDIETYLPSSVVLIEWGENHISRLTDTYLAISLTTSDGENVRHLTIKPVGGEVFIQRWEKILGELSS